MYTEDQFLPLSSVSQYVHCPRRCALIHLEQTWADNVYTAEGDVLHDKVDSGKSESRGDLKIIRSLRLHSFHLGISGITDVVEFHRCPTDEAGIQIPGATGLWTPFPVEYKRGAAKDIRCYEVQICAQALCLEEMLGIDTPEGALFLGEKQHRVPVVFNNVLRKETEAVCLAVHNLFDSGITPPGEYSKRCRSCSLIENCLPQSAGTGKSVRKWLTRQIDELCSDSDEIKDASLSETLL